VPEVPESRGPDPAPEEDAMKRNRIMRTTAVLLPLLGLLLLSAGCKKKAIEISPDISSSDEALFKLGEQEMKKDRDKAVLYLRQVIDSFPKSFYAQRAKLLIADAYFQKGDESNMILAAAEYREFIRSYPYSPSAAYAQYQVAMTFYKKILKPGRDQTKTTQALAEFRKVIADYPASDQAKQAQEKVKECEERLAEHAVGIGRHYHNMKAYHSAIGRLTEVMTTYPDYSRMDEVYFYIGSSFFKLNMIDQAVPYLTKVVSDYPRSKLAKQATKLLKKIEARKKAQPGEKKEGR
jgi:outer membrane protein assembly factor BamD